MVYRQPCQYGLIETGHTLIPIEGLDPNDMKALAKVMPTLSAKFSFSLLGTCPRNFSWAIVADRLQHLIK